MCARTLAIHISQGARFYRSTTSWPCQPTLTFSISSTNPTFQLRFDTRQVHSATRSQVRSQRAEEDSIRQSIYMLYLLTRCLSVRGTLHSKFGQQITWAKGMQTVNALQQVCSFGLSYFHAQHNATWWSARESTCPTIASNCQRHLEIVARIGCGKNKSLHLATRKSQSQIRNPTLPNLPTSNPLPFQSII